MHRQGYELEGREPDAIDRGTAAGPAKAVFTYTNWRGETSRRSVVPDEIGFGTSVHHPEPQWLMRAYDLDREDWRVFAMNDMTGYEGPAVPFVAQFRPEGSQR